MATAPAAPFDPVREYPCMRPWCESVCTQAGSPHDDTRAVKFLTRRALSNSTEAARL